MIGPCSARRPRYIREKTLKNSNLLSAILLSATAVCLGANAAEHEKTALKDIFGEHFLVGGALNRWVVSSRDAGAARLAVEHFNTATPENDMKWALIHPSPDRYNWDPADRFVDFARNHNMAPIGHCLVWHSQVPQIGRAHV